jgi:hypothetical protein
MASLMPWAICTSSTRPFEELDCVEVQESVRHLEDHIQSIQVLNCSSIDLHMLSVCS